MNISEQSIKKASQKREEKRQQKLTEIREKGKNNLVDLHPKSDSVFKQLINDDIELINEIKKYFLGKDDIDLDRIQHIPNRIIPVNIKEGLVAERDISLCIDYLENLLLEMQQGNLKNNNYRFDYYSLMGCISNQKAGDSTHPTYGLKKTHLIAFIDYIDKEHFIEKNKISSIEELFHDTKKQLKGEDQRLQFVYLVSFSEFEIFRNQLYI